MNYELLTCLNDKIKHSIQENHFVQGHAITKHVFIKNKNLFKELFTIISKQNSCKHDTDSSNILSTKTKFSKVLKMLMDENLLSDKEFVTKCINNLDKCNNILKEICPHYKKLKEIIIKIITNEESLSNSRDTCKFFCRLLKKNICLLRNDNTYENIRNNDNSKTIILLETLNLYTLIDITCNEQLKMYLEKNDYNIYYTEREINDLKILDLKEVLNKRRIPFDLKSKKSDLLKLLKL